MQMLFQGDVGKQTPEEVRQMFWQTRDDVEEETRGFTEGLFRVATAREAEIDGLIEEHSENWRLERMSSVDRNLLRTAVAEMLGFPGTPAPIVINEALEIARRYSAPDRSVSEWAAGCDCAGAAELLKRNFCGLGDVEHRLVAGALLPGDADGFNLRAVGGRVGIVDDQHLGAQAFGVAHTFALPLSIAIEDAEAVGETRRDFLVEEVAPAGLGHAGLGVCGAKAEE